MPLRVLRLLDAGVRGEAELLQPGQVGDVGQVPQLAQLVVGERQAGQAAGQVLAAFAEMRTNLRFKMTKNKEGFSNLELSVTNKVNHRDHRKPPSI